MGVWGLVVALIPLVAFVIIDAYKGLRAGVWAAIILSIVSLIVFSILMGRLDELALLETLLILVLGGVTLMMNNERFFKFQPLVVGVILSGVCAYLQWFDEPILVKTIPRMAAIMDQEQVEILMRPEMQRYYAKLSGWLIGLFLVHGLLVGKVAMGSSNKAWIASRLAIYPMAFATMLLAGIF